MQAQGGHSTDLARHSSNHHQQHELKGDHFSLLHQSAGSNEIHQNHRQAQGVHSTDMVRQSSNPNQQHEFKGSADDVNHHEHRQAQGMHMHASRRHQQHDWQLADYLNSVYDPPPTDPVRYRDSSDAENSEGGDPVALMSTYEAPWHVNEPNASSDAAICEQDMFARMEECPESCPYAAEMQKQFCHFRCVPGNECGLLGTVTQATIPDHHHHECRRCEVEGCKTCVPGKPGEKVELCEECMPGYFLLEGGEKCGSIGDYVFGSIAVVLVVVTLVFACWYVDLACRPVVNDRGLMTALAARNRTRVRPMRQQGAEVGGDAASEAYPLSTNLMGANIAGPGTMCLFRYQCALLVWAFVLILVWLIMGLAVDTDIFLVGIRKAETPQEFCAVIAWGRKRQMELVYLKCIWLGIAYGFSFVGALIFAVIQHRLFDRVNNETTSMTDFTAVIPNLPQITGDNHAEEELREAISRHTQERVVGVSVCWDYHHHLQQVTQALEQDMGSIESTRAAARQRGSRGSQVMNLMVDSASVASEEEAGCIRRIFNSVNRATLARWGALPEENQGADHGHGGQGHSIEHTLCEMQATERAFVVFETEHGRDRALQASSEGIPFKDSTIELQNIIHEPEEVIWEEFGVSEGEHFSRMVKAYFITTATAVVWTVLLYLPYAKYMASFSYANGDEPGPIAETLFVCLVVAGNLCICVAAAVCVKSAGFRFVDDEERAYISLYNFALSLNLILDMMLTAFLSYRQMVGRGVHTADGRLLQDLGTYQEIFESYPMQKALGNTIYHYCWPATFFLPFVAEPLALVVFPHHVGCLFIRSRKDLDGKRAEKALALPIMEQARYADVIFNVNLVVLIPFIAPGYMLKVFIPLLFSHVVIYAYDHWKVLRSALRFNWSGDSVNSYAQKLFSVPTGLLAAGLVFKVNQWSGDPKILGSGYLHGEKMWGCMLCACVVHIVIHLLLLEYLVPVLGNVERVQAEDTYEACSRKTPCSYFSSNPVHCLRSKYIYKHNPPQGYYIVGKEHLLVTNAKIGAHFEASSDAR